MTMRILAAALFAASLSLPASAQTLEARAGVSRAKGQEAAKLRVLEISDFQCPYCARFAVEVYPKIDSAYVKPGKVQWVFVNMPLPGHGNAWVAAEAALCAGGTGDAFWPMHDRIFASQAEWGPSADPAPVFRRFAQQSAVALEAYDACVAGDRVARVILQDLMYALSLRVNGTPAFQVGEGQTVVGVKSFEEWKQILDAALLKANAPAK
jgi:protein-disulfide isomerase